MRISAWFIALILWIHPVIGHTLSVVLKKEVGVDQTKVYLRDLGEVTATKSELMWGADSTPVMDIPAKKTFMDAKSIQDALIKALHNENITVVGDGIMMYPHYTSVISQEVTEKVKQAFMRIYPQFKNNRILVNYLEQPNVLHIPSGIKEIRVYVPGGKLGLIKYVRVVIKGYRETVYDHSFPMRIRVLSPIKK